MSDMRLATFFQAGAATVAGIAAVQFHNHSWFLGCIDIFIAWNMFYTAQGFIAAENKSPGE